MQKTSVRASKQIKVSSDSEEDNEYDEEDNEFDEEVGSETEDNDSSVQDANDQKTFAVTLSQTNTSQTITKTEEIKVQTPKSIVEESKGSARTSKREEEKDKDSNNSSNFTKSNSKNNNVVNNNTKPKTPKSPKLPSLSCLRSPPSPRETSPKSETLTDEIVPEPIKQKGYSLPNGISENNKTFEEVQSTTTNNNMSSSRSDNSQPNISTPKKAQSSTTSSTTSTGTDVRPKLATIKKESGGSGTATFTMVTTPPAVRATSSSSEIKRMAPTLTIKKELSYSSPAANNIATSTDHTFISSPPPPPSSSITSTSTSSSANTTSSTTVAAATTSTRERRAFPSWSSKSERVKKSKESQEKKETPTSAEHEAEANNTDDKNKETRPRKETKTQKRRPLSGILTASWGSLRGKSHSRSPSSGSSATLSPTTLESPNALKSAPSTPQLSTIQRPPPKKSTSRLTQFFTIKSKSTAIDTAESAPSLPLLTNPVSARSPSLRSVDEEPSHQDSNPQSSKKVTATTTTTTGDQKTNPPPEQETDPKVELNSYPEKEAEPFPDEPLKPNIPPFHSTTPAIFLTPSSLTKTVSSNGAVDSPESNGEAGKPSKPPRVKTSNAFGWIPPPPPPPPSDPPLSARRAPPTRRMTPRTPDNPIDEEKRKRQRVYILDELIKTEKEYIADLENIVKEIMEPLKKKKNFLTGENLLTEEQISTIFSNVIELPEGNKHLLKSLSLAVYGREDVSPDTPLLPENDMKIGTAFIESTVFFSTYVTYCANQPKSNKLIELLKNDAQFEAFLEEKRSLIAELKMLDLNAFLIKPMQRICKYPLFLRDLIKSTRSDNCEYFDLGKALDAIDKVVRDINEKKRAAEKLAAIQEIQSALYFPKKNDPEEFILMANGREWIDTHVFKKVQYKKENINDGVVFIFSDLIVVAKNRPVGVDRKYLHKVSIPLAEHVITDFENNNAKSEFILELHRKNYDNVRVLLTASSVAEKMKWKACAAQAYAVLCPNPS
eukprot:TRINITY_DN3483_c0_g1_i1.p1 TRINITY_DN3483_c0_g1~~TRINITY_DN3483_c0_g1_i1.p1  ORF type:complete len:1004 (-),score=264.50 TRINITY_DN3483_c0_g1_i1:59-3070(-)